MALKLEVTFDVGVKIVGDADNYTPIKDQIVIVCEPFTSGTYNSETIPNFTQLANQPFVNDINTYNATYIIQNTVFTNVFVFNPTHVEEVNGKLKCTVPHDMHEVIRFIKKYNYFYERVDGGQELKRKDTPSEISNSTKKSSSIVKNPVVGDDDEDGEIETNDEFAFEIQSGSIDPTGAEITYNFTSTRDLTIYKEVNGNFVFNETGTISDLDLSTQDVSTLLNLAFSDHNLYYETEASGATQNFALDSGIDIQQNNKKIVLQVNPAGGKLVQTSSATTTALKGPTSGNIVATDQFKLFLEIAEDFTFTNNIKNPIIKARIDPSDAKDGYIVLDLYESSNANAPLIENLTPYSGNDNGTLRHGTDITQTDNTDHPVASSFSISSTNSYTNLGNFDFKFKEAGEKNITDNEGNANSHLIVDQRPNDRDVIKLRLDRFPRHGVDYDITYTHKLNKTSGIFNDDGNAVISDSTTPLDIANSLQEVTATVGKLKVHYPPSVPGNFAGNSQDFNEYSEYTAYYYVDITFQRAGTNGNVDITAKYNNNYEYQYESGHNIHHGLIIDSGAADGNINEDITRTRIGNINSATGDFTPVDLRSNSNQTGNVLRIEVPIAVTGASASNRYPYELGNSPGLTKYNLTDSNNTPSIHLIDREELDEEDNSYPVPQYYYINVMDSLGNVVSPIANSTNPENLIKDDDWGKDSDEKTPSVASIEYKVRWDSNANQGQGAWVKELVLTHNQDLQGAGVETSLALIDDESPAWELPVVVLGSGASASVLTVSINDNDNTLLTSEVAAGNITLAYTKPTEDPQNILTNWLGFEIEEYNGDDAKTVTLPTGNGNTNPEPPVVQSLSLSVGSINDTTDEAGTNPSFEIPLTWTISGSTNGITYDVEQSTDGGINWTNADTENANNIDTASTTGATVSGLSYNTAYTFRVKVTTYETSVPSTTTLSSQNGPAGELSNVSIFSNISGDDGYPKVVISWNKPDNATQYKIEWDTGVNFDQLSTQTEVEGLSGFNVGEETVSYTFEGENSLLNPNETYYFRPSYSTTSSYPYTFGPATQVVGPVTTFPEEIETITVENSNDDNTINYNALNVSWTKPADDDGDVDYEIQYDTSSQFNSANTVPITGDTHLIDGLDASTTYYIRVRSKNESPDNPPTSQYTAWVPSDIGTSKLTNAMPPAGAPTNFSLGLDNAANTHKIEAGWNKPNDETYIYEYKLEVSTDSSYGTNDIIATITNGFTETTGEITTTVSITIDDSDIAGTFSGNTTYYLRASIRKSDDNGTSWGNYGATSGNNIVTVYDKITNYTAWGGDKADNYPDWKESLQPTTIYYAGGLDIDANQWNYSWGDGQAPNTLGDLHEKLEISENANFTSPDTKYVQSHPGSGSGKPDYDTGFKFSGNNSAGGLSFFNTWRDIDNNIQELFNKRRWIRIYLGNPDSYAGDHTPLQSDGQTEYTNWGLYHEFNILHVPGKPQNISVGALSITANSFDIEWDKETYALNVSNPPSGYTYEYTYKLSYSSSSTFPNNDTLVWSAIAHPSSPNIVSQSVTNLNGNTRYYVKVASSNQREGTNYIYGISDDVNGGNGVLTLPSQVTGLTSSIQHTSVTLTWTAIGGEAFDTSETSNDGYTVEYSSDSGSTWNESDNHITLLTHTVTGLTSETTYQFRVYATNASGDGAASTSLSVTTNATPDTTPPIITGPSGSAGDATSSISINENTTTVYTFSANEIVTWSLNGGDDADEFTIDSTGALSFNSAPNFENPTDTDTNNVYVVVIRATDSATNTSDQTVTVSVVDVDETSPTMTITAANSSGTAIANGSTTNDSPIVLTFTSSESTTTFAVEDITVTNGTLGTFSGTETTYTVQFTPSAINGLACTIDVAESTFTDAAGNDNTAATQFEWTYDNTAPAFSQGSVPATGDKITLEFDEELELGGSVTTITGFSVSLYGAGSGSLSTTVPIAFDPADSSKIVITMQSASIYDPGESNSTTGVEVEYIQPGGDSNLRDAAGNLLGPFTTTTVANGNNNDEITNNSEVSPPDNQAPNLTPISSPPTLGNNNKPQFSFTSDEAGTISITSTHSSSISVSNTSTNDQAVAIGSNTFELTNSTGGGLSDNTYTGVVIAVADSASNTSSITLPDFEIDTTAPAITSQSSAEWYYETEGEGEMSGETTWTMLTNAATFGPTNKIKCFVSVTELNGLSLKSGTDVVKIDGTTMGSADSVDCYAQPGGNIHYVEMIYTIPATDTPNANGDLTFEFTLKDDAGNELDLSSNNIGPGGNSSIPNTDAITIDTTRPNLSNFSWKFSSFPNLDTTPEFEIQSDEVGTISATYNNGTDAFTISPTTINANSLTTFTLSDSTGSALAVGTYNDVSFNVVDDAGNSASMSVSDLVVDSYDWSQLGSDIDGGAAGDNSGWSVALNSDGTKLAIGAPHNDGNGSSSGHVRVYENISGTWTQLGDDIDGDAAGDQSGHSLSLSDDGSIVAIGAPYNDGSYSDSGNVRVYEWDATANSNNGAWTQKGGDIDGDVTDDYSGRSVSLSSDGSIVAIGANLNDGNGESAGHVRVFLYSDTNDSWSQLGGDIDGEAAGDNSGWSVSLSSDGSIVAIGANGNDGNGSASGHVRVYQYSNSSNNWSQLGDDIDGEAADDQSGHSLSLSDDGSIVAIGAPYNDGSYSDSGNVRVYEYISGTWTQLGADIDGEAAVDYSGRSVSLSSDGTKLAIGAPFNDGNGSNSGHVRVYEFITILPTMTITSNTVTSGSFSYDTEIDLTFTSSKKTNDFELSDITLNNTTDGTLSDFITVLKVTVQSVSGGDKYFINGIQQDSLVLESGNTYRFDQSDSTNSGRLIKFSITIDGTYGGGSEYTTEVTAVGTLGQSGSYTEIEITGSTPTTLYYYCSQHSGMGGSVSIASTNLTKTDEYVAKLTTTQNDAYTINVAANLFTDENLLMNLSAPQFAWTRVDQGWNQLGSDIDGEAAGDQSGRSVSLSSDGSIVAIGAPYNDGSYSDSGHVRVYENISGTWTQLGADIDGAAGGDYSGRSVSLSSDGTIVAIGANKNDDNGNNSGHVIVYQYSSSTTPNWTQLGADIDGEASYNYSGWSVSLSNDGSIVAIGAIYNAGGGNSNSGHVRVYENKIPTQNEWDNGNVIKGADAGNANPTGGTKYWVQLGTDIDGEASGDYSGWSVALSNDGTIVAIGANKNDDNGNNSGHVKVYQYSNNSWTPKGFDIDGEAADDESGIAVALSNDGSIVAIGANKNDAGNTNTTDDRGHVRVYKNKIPTQNEWDNGNVIKGDHANNANPTSGTKYWVQLGTDIDGEAVGDYSGYSVSLSSDGEIVAIGAIYNGETGSGSGHVRVYQYTSGSWTQKGDDMDGEATGDNSGRSVSLSSDGTIVAIGAPVNDAGNVRVYKWY